MTNDIRFLSRERFARMKDATTSVPKNRHERRAAQRHAKLLEATRIRAVGQKSAPHVADSAKERHEDTLRAELEAQEIHSTGTRAGRLVALAAALELIAAACGSAMTDDQDMTQDSDAVTDVGEEDNSPDLEVDRTVEDVSAEDVETPDEGTVEDVAPEVEDGGVEETADVPDVEDILDTPEVEDVPEAEASDGEEADATDAPDVEEDGVEFVDGTDETEATDTYDCTETVTIEPGTPVSGPELLCGSTQTATPTFEETSWVGADCEGTSTTRRMIRKDVVVTPPLDTAGLACARGTTTNALNGTELIVDLTSADFNTAITVVPCQFNMSTGGVLDGGVAEYDAEFQDVPWPYEITLRVRPPSGSSRLLSPRDTGVAEVWTGDRGYVAFDIDFATWHTSLCYVYAPINTRTAGFGEVWSVDGGTFTFNPVFSTDGMQLLGWEWVRP